MVTDRLSIFISSTIRECAAERAVARDAIRSLNHDPVLFEDLGARPYPPRELYKARLEAAHVFVGIYRESYGWVAPDMSISGIEDEFQLAENRGMDRLIYVLAAPVAREPRLQAMLDRAMDSGVTVSFYAVPDELPDRIRDDVTAVISNRFADQALGETSAILPNDVLDALVPQQNQRLRRSAVERALIDQSKDSQFVVVTGPLGSGKTMLLAQVAAAENWAFVDARGRTTLEVLAQAANVLRARLRQPPMAFLNELSATSSLIAAWEATGGTTLVLDGIPDAEPVWKIVARAGLPIKARLIIASRSELATPQHQQFKIPSLSEEEVRSLVTALRARAPDPGELVHLMHRSAGNPLFLRFYALGEPGGELATLRELEIKALVALEPRVRELVFYLALAGRSLSLQALSELLAEGESAEAVAELLSRGAVLLRQIRSDVDVIHEHVRDAVLEHLGANSIRQSFFSARLADYLTRTGDYVTAFLVADRAGDHRRAARMLDRAAFQVARRGGGRQAVPVFRAKVERAKTRGNVEELVFAHLALAEALQQIGDIAEAQESIARARATVEEADDSDLNIRIREVELILQLSKGANSGAVDQLRSLKNQYAEAGDEFNTARIALSLSAEYIAAQEPDSALGAAQEAFRMFMSLGDDYGARLARLNLVSALSGLSGRSADVIEHLEALDESIDPDDAPRERAAICNFQTRHHRQIGKPDVAEQYAREAVEIGERLGDKRLIALNRINLGNSLRDQNRLAETLAEYRLADRNASDGGQKRLEAAANELIASVANEQKDHRAALVHADYAVAVARDANDWQILARAHEEKGLALVGLRRVKEAIDVYAAGASPLAESHSNDALFVGLLRNALDTAVEHNQSDLIVSVLLRVFSGVGVAAADSSGPQEKIASLSDLIPKIIEHVPDRPLIPMLSLIFADQMAQFPPIVEREVVLYIVDSIVSQSLNASPERKAAALAGVLLGTEWQRLKDRDFVIIAQKIAAAIPGVYFKPHPDGAAHWTVSLPISQGIICTVTQLDDAPALAAVATLVVLLLRELAPLIAETLLGVEQLPRAEVHVNVVGQSEFELHIERELSGLTRALDTDFVVGQSSDVTQSDQPPIVIICGDAFGERWHPHAAGLSRMHILVAQLLESMIAHLLAKEVEVDVVHPKIARIVRQISTAAR
jgi:tetratricopeptide (TPR) repeat protein